MVHSCPAFIIYTCPYWYIHFDNVDDWGALPVFPGGGIRLAEGRQKSPFVFFWERNAKSPLLATATTDTANLRAGRSGCCGGKTVAVVTSF